MTGRSVGFAGTGYAVPASIRRNDDPAFDALRHAAGAGAELALFYGNRERRYLQEGDSLSGLAAEAGRAALRDAGLEPSDVERLYGYVSVSEYVVPNALYAVHRDLGLGRDAWVVPVQGEFANFLMGAVLAKEAIDAGAASRALVVAGGAWTRNMDYTQGHSVGIGDGAGAAVIAETQRLVIVDWAADTFSNEYGAMAMQRWPDKPYAYPTYGIDPRSGIEAFLKTGMEEPPKLVARLLARNGILPEDVTLISHQATRKLMDHWADRIGPHAYLDTFEIYGNMALASVPVTLAHHAKAIATPWLVLVSVGIGAHQMAMLVRV